MKTRNVLLNLAGSAITCFLLVGVGEATVPRAFVSTTGSDARSVWNKLWNESNRWQQFEFQHQRQYYIPVRGD
ncbi:MAG TPA: hypothetical protein VKJ45_29505 [Blastocatellia bacterium]|nr:hypothetical protein [Blastocatellia bacterium]